MKTPTPPSPHRRHSGLTTTLAAAALLGLTVVPADARAAVPEAAVVPSQAHADPDIDRALELEARAQAYADLPDEHHRVAGLLVQAAEYREDSDPHKVENLRTAARLYWYRDRFRQAESAAVDAAELARRQGDVVQAGHAYLDAALVAAERGAAESAHRWVAEAQMLADSPLLDAEARAGLMDRVEGLA